MPQTDPGNFCWLIYPEYERKLLPDLAAYLDRYDAQGIFSFLLDMYGPGTIAEAVATPRRSPLDAILTVSISGAAGCAFLAYRGRTSPNTTSPAARDGACFFRARCRTECLGCI